MDEFHPIHVPRKAATIGGQFFPVQARLDLHRKGKGLLLSKRPKLLAAHINPMGINLR